MWLTKLKTALVLEDIETLSSLLDEMPQFETIEQMEEASYLLIQTKTLIEKNKLHTAQILQQLKNNLNFLKSTQTEAPSSLNLKF
ncbi:hypothetical protein [Sulfuricurvum sp.]|uniref:hypothetical protein n=1 Tax=Sulfuricurvum sp. TaxID=2025608 RepID=UPI002E3154AB|nr:hypothetical protein [Sulfuricurvum sp.]HEX5330578.1 hypothetical protein [Sulfuricurvum sp.]